MLMEYKQGITEHMLTVTDISIYKFSASSAYKEFEQD